MRALDESSFREQAEKDGITHLSTGVAVLRGGKVLIVRRAAADFHGGQYELPGGGVDEGETITDAAIREVKEETGLTVSRIVSMFDGFDYTTDRKPRVRQINFMVEVEDGEVVLDPDEHDDFQWVDGSTELDNLMSEDMKTCVDEALRLACSMQLYLFTLEVAPLTVGEVYNPLPAHLTLVSRFWSELQSGKIAESAEPIFSKSKPVELLFGDEAVIGPKKTAVHLVKNTTEIKHLHSDLLEALTKLRVSFTSPQFIAEGHLPHVSKRQNVQFAIGHRQPARHAYLIGVKVVGNEHRRTILVKFKLGN